ncbi:hypothetical protein [Pantoea sp. At-9b]|uniref:hypothetical protein n=1 Tax=Pantoea sp. (strain At-9b) TaxID=592316 RepID=UPI0001B3EBC2|nr:hypothetical protein [Pantoea sp. At-9b]
MNINPPGVWCAIHWILMTCAVVLWLLLALRIRKIIRLNAMMRDWRCIDLLRGAAQEDKAATLRQMHADAVENVDLQINITLSWSSLTAASFLFN